MRNRFFSLLIGYLFGCILTAEIVSYCRTGKSAREIGSGNPGMANIMSNLGKIPGILTLLGDIAKTAAAMGISALLFAERSGRICIQYAGLGAVLGHNFPFWRHGKGGKGVTVTCTWIILAYGIWGVLADLCGAAVVFVTGWLPLAAVVLTVAALPVAFVTAGLEGGLLAVCSLLLMISRHWHGLHRIIRGEEAPHLKLLGRKSSK